MIKPIPKPGKPKKKSKIWNKGPRQHYIEKPKIDYCIRCKAKTDTLRLCHYEGFFKLKYGKGTGKKVDDRLTTLLCNTCDLIMAKKPNKDDFKAILEFEIEWCWLIIDYQILI